MKFSVASLIALSACVIYVAAVPHDEYPHSPYGSVGTDTNNGLGMSYHQPAETPCPDETNHYSPYNPTAVSSNGDVATESHGAMAHGDHHHSDEGDHDEVDDYSVDAEPTEAAEAADPCETEVVDDASDEETEDGTPCDHEGDDEPFPTTTMDYSAATDVSLPQVTDLYGDDKASDNLYMSQQSGASSSAVVSVAMAAFIGAAAMIVV